MFSLGRSGGGGEGMAEASKSHTVENTRIGRWGLVGSGSLPISAHGKQWVWLIVCWVKSLDNEHFHLLLGVGGSPTLPTFSSSPSSPACPPPSVSQNLVISSGVLLLGQLQGSHQLPNTVYKQDSSCQVQDCLPRPSLKSLGDRSKTSPL